MNEQLIHLSMLSIASINPESEALRFKEKTLLYKELKLGSANITSHLITLKLEKEDCVGLFMDKRIEAILAIYGVMQSGCVYVPLDIKNPVSRIEYIIDQCSISTFITTPDHIEKLTSILSEAGGSYSLLVLTDQKWGHPTNDSFQYEVINPLRNSDLISDSDLKNKNIKPEDIVAILYTSGSTGTPKGVMISHFCIMTFIQWALEEFKINSKDRCISHAPLHFDLSLLDVFASLSAGATVVLIPDTIVGNPKAITRLISKEKITIWQSVPSVLVLLLKYGDIEKHQYNQLRHVIFSGEKFSTSNLKSISQYFNSSAFHNIYGSTETNDTFIYSIEASAEIYPDPLPIGKPLPYVDYKVINTNKQSASETLIGELLVKTPTQMCGYKGDRANNTEEYFKTKDIVTILPDGNLIFNGRTDDIIKSNGYRVNMLEIESALQEHEKISDVAVISIPDDEIGNKIIAIITAPTSANLSAINLKIFSAKKLPRYAIPHFFKIDAKPLPKTSSGKTNKQILIKQGVTHDKQAQP